MKPETAKAIGNLASIAELVAQARTACQAITEVGRPEGGITVKEYAKGPPLIGETTAREHLKRLVDIGRYEMIVAIAAEPGGMPRKVSFYRKVTHAVDRIR